MGFLYTDTSTSTLHHKSRRCYKQLNREDVLKINRHPLNRHRDYSWPPQQTNSAGIDGTIDKWIFNQTIKKRHEFIDPIKEKFDCHRQQQHQQHQEYNENKNEYEYSWPPHLIPSQSYQTIDDDKILCRKLFYLPKEKYRFGLYDSIKQFFNQNENDKAIIHKSISCNELRRVVPTTTTMMSESLTSKNTVDKNSYDDYCDEKNENDIENSLNRNRDDYCRRLNDPKHHHHSHIHNNHNQHQQNQNYYNVSQINDDYSNGNGNDDKAGGINFRKLKLEQFQGCTVTPPPSPPPPLSPQQPTITTTSSTKYVQAKAIENNYLIEQTVKDLINLERKLIAGDDDDDEGGGATLEMSIQELIEFIRKFNDERIANDSVIKTCLENIADITVRLKKKSSSPIVPPVPPPPSSSKNQIHNNRADKDDEFLRQMVIIDNRILTEDSQPLINDLNYKRFINNCADVDAAASTVIVVDDDYENVNKMASLSSSSSITGDSHHLLSDENVKGIFVVYHCSLFVIEIFTVG